MTVSITKDLIIARAKHNWDAKNFEEKFKCGKKYKHILTDTFDWNLPFDSLVRDQKIILLKGELIRTYDNLPNIIKTKLKKNLNLSEFSSKWYKLPSTDKLILLREYVL